MRRLCALAAVCMLAAGASAVSQQYTSIQRKFQQIDKKQVKPGQRISLTAAELNAYVQTELPKVAPPGVRRPAVQLQGNNRASGAALIDFVKLRTSQGKPPNWLLRKLLEGEHEVSVTARVQSGGGQATVHLEQVQISGVPISGGALDWVVQNYLIPHYPDAKVGRPFALRHGVDRIEVTPGVAYVVMR
ncbi:MAG TPA: hypothetical protein VES20_21435 [Bryobacteraceae bacterium]|nr:hypothetical protein [Bryobacteraceae bacterium]